MTAEEATMYESIIRRCMEYYDGKINVFNTPVNYDINWLGAYDYYKAGCTFLPNRITFYPKPMARILNDEESCRFCLMESVIHELFHTDQIIDFNSITINQNYVQYIERAVELETAKYMYSHPAEIKKFTGIDIYDSEDFMFYLIDKIWYHPFVWYHRRTFYSHVAMCLHNTLIRDEYEWCYNKLIENMMLNKSGQKPGRLELIINDNLRLLIYDEQYTCPVEAFNNFMYNNLCHEHLYVKCEYDGTILKTYVRFSETMCRI